MGAEGTYRVCFEDGRTETYQTRNKGEAEKLAKKDYHERVIKNTIVIALSDSEVLEAEKETEAKVSAVKDAEALRLLEKQAQAEEKKKKKK